MRKIWRGTGAFLLAAVSAGCGGASSGDNVTCGPGTKLDGSVCYVAPLHAADATAGGVSDAQSSGQSGVVFGGVTAAAPASTTALFLAWAPAVAAGMADASSSAFTYNVYAANDGPGRPWALDVLPFIVPAAEWDSLARGLRQRGLDLNEIPMPVVCGEIAESAKGIEEQILVPGVGVVALIDRADLKSDDFELSVADFARQCPS